MSTGFALAGCSLNSFPLSLVSISNADSLCRWQAMEYQDLLSGFVRLHVLHHAAEGDLHGLWMIEELARHGYKISAGTLYPMLHSLEKKGYLASRIERLGRTRRRIYNATPYGLAALEKTKEKAKELFREILSDSSA